MIADLRTSARTRAISKWPAFAESFKRKCDVEMFDFEHSGVKWTATISRFADGRVAEIFLNTPKVSAIGELASEAAIVASLALQNGCPIAVLQHALDGRDTGPLSAALSRIEGTP